ncbi:glycoside hydrolase family protein [Desulfovibrio litoralis]|uniref:Lysozyme n=1 Tax=Desulfovibrio litoralis DSM 11393 TaxID=1121455 RepID=A0A1M7TJ12_9BACT|nr:glycoside hydrolase family protein [Desulfovibrio litoralis]SHN70608.1 Phage lysozyme [Desulfovibrio litoralis DSM 11393]
MYNNPLFLKQIKRHEGCKKNKDGLHVAYRCTAKKLTIGYGHNLDANPIPGLILKEKDTINEEQAERLLKADILACIQDLNSHLSWWITLNEARKAVLINMCFNLGITKLLTFKKTLHFIRIGNYKQAAKNMMCSLWSKQVGDGIGGYFDRAEELAKQMQSGKWQEV